MYCTLQAMAESVIFSSGDATRQIISDDLLSLNNDDFNNTMKYEFYQKECTNCNEVQF